MKLLPVCLFYIATAICGIVIIVSGFNKGNNDIVTHGLLLTVIGFINYWGYTLLNKEDV